MEKEGEGVIFIVGAGVGLLDEGEGDIFTFGELVGAFDEGEGARVGVKEVTFSVPTAWLVELLVST
jgi:hypothetical protein